MAKAIPSLLVALLCLASVGVQADEFSSMAQTMIFARQGGAATGRASAEATPREVYVNRVKLEAQLLQTMETRYQTPIEVGRYWLDAQGNLGPEGGAAIANLAAAIQAASAAQAGGSGSVTHGYDQTYGARGTLAGGMYSGRTAGGKSVLWYPGM